MRLLPASRLLCYSSTGIRPPLSTTAHFCVTSTLLRHYSAKKKAITNADIANLVPLNGRVDYVDTRGTFHKNQPIVAVLNSLKGSGHNSGGGLNMLLAVSIVPRGEMQDPQVVCRIVPDKDKVREAARIKNKEEKRLAREEREEQQEQQQEQEQEQQEEEMELEEDETKESKKHGKREKKQSKEPHKAKDRSKNQSKVKTLSLNWTIGPKDLLNQKKATIQGWLEKGHPVHIFLGSARVRGPPKKLTELDLEKRELLRKTCKEMCEETGAIRQNAANVVKTDTQEVFVYFLPTRQESSETTQ